MNVRRYLSLIDDHEEKKVPFLRVIRGRCANLIRTMPLQNHDEHNPEDMDTKLEDHAPDTLRYLLSGRPEPSVRPAGRRRQEISKTLPLDIQRDLRAAMDREEETDRMLERYGYKTMWG